MVMGDINMNKEKLIKLLEMAKKNKNVLEYQEINDFFKDEPSSGAQQMEKVFDFLEASGVDVRITDNSQDELILDDNLDTEEEISPEMPIGQEESHLGDCNFSVPADVENVRVFNILKEQIVEMGALSALTEREKKLLRLRFGLDGSRAHMREEIGTFWGLSSERVQQIENRILRKVFRNHPHRRAKLHLFLKK